MLNAPVLQLDAARIHEIDPRNVESLFGMWTVFSRCATTIPDGKRLENMSWRIWARETLCCPPQPEKIIVPAIDVSPARSSGVPSLSNSVDSDASAEETKVFAFSSRRERVRKLSDSEDSALSKSRGKEAHLTSHTLEKIVTTIQETTIQEKSELKPLSPRIEAVVNAKMQPEPLRLTQPGSLELTADRRLPFSTESSCISTATATTVGTARQSDHRDSETSVSSVDADGLIRSGSVVHGFSPAASSFRSSRARLSIGQPSLASSLRSSQTKNLQAPANKSGMFTLGGSSEDDESSFDSRMSPYKRPSSDIRTSSLSKTLATKGLAQKATTSFKAFVEQHRLQNQKEGANEDEGAIASSDEDDDDEDDEDVVESAIDEEEDDDDDEEDDNNNNNNNNNDEEEWVDSHSDDDRDAKDHDFKRIDSRPNLVSQRSVLTQGLTENERASGLITAATKSQASNPNRRSRGISHNGPSMPCSPEESNEDSGLMMQRPKGSKPLPIISTTSNTYAMAHSPRTTRRNMLSTELTQSLRQNLLWERQQKNTTVNAFLKRQAQSMANLQRLNPPQPLPNTNGLTTGTRPSAPMMPQEPDQHAVARNNNSWNHYFDNPWEYHAKGW